MFLFKKIPWRVSFEQRRCSPSLYVIKTLATPVTTPKIFEPGLPVVGKASWKDRWVGKFNVGKIFPTKPSSMYKQEVGKHVSTQKVSQIFKIFPTAFSNYMHTSNPYFRFSPSFQRRFGTTMSVTTRSHSSSTDLITCSKKKVIIITVAVVILLAVTVTLLVVFLKWCSSICVTDKCHQQNCIISAINIQVNQYPQTKNC